MDRKTSFKPGDMADADAVSIFSSSDIAMVLTNPRLEDNPIVYVNQAFERLTGYSKEAALGRNCRFLQSKKTPPEQLDDLRDAIRDGREIATVLLNERADGEAFLNALLVSPIRAADDDDGDPIYFIGLQSQLSEDKQSERMAQFEMVVSEIQHRVKNHLSMILGLIRMKARGSETPEAYGDLSRRIESLQLLYEEMSASQHNRNDNKIQLGAYLGRVANAIAHLDGRPGVRMNVDVEPLVVDTEQAVRIGLIISEVLTNAMQHAFEDQKTGLVELHVARTDGGGMRATISDDGIGLPEGSSWPEDGGMGGRIVEGLCAGLDATLNISRGAVGTQITLEVPAAD